MYQRLQKLNVTLSYSAVNRLVYDLSVDHDVMVLQWRDRLAQSLENQQHEVFNHPILFTNLIKFSIIFSTIKLQVYCRLVVEMIQTKNLALCCIPIVNVAPIILQSRWISLI